MGRNRLMAGSLERILKDQPDGGFVIEAKDGRHKIGFRAAAQVEVQWGRYSGMTRVFVERQLLPGMLCCELPTNTVRLVKAGYARQRAHPRTFSPADLSILASNANYKQHGVGPADDRAAGQYGRPGKGSTA